MVKWKLNVNNLIIGQIILGVLQPFFSGEILEELKLAGFYSLGFDSTPLDETMRVYALVVRWNFLD